MTTQIMRLHSNISQFIVTEVTQIICLVLKPKIQVEARTRSKIRNSFNFVRIIFMDQNLDGLGKSEKKKGANYS